MEVLDETDDGRKRIQEKGAMDKQMVVEDLENTISSLASYLISNSPPPLQPRISSPHQVSSLTHVSPTQSFTSAEHRASSSATHMAPSLPYYSAANDEAMRSLQITPAGSISSIAREMVSSQRVESPVGIFRPISAADLTKSPLGTPTRAYDPLSEEVPPPLPKRGPPIRSSPNPEVFSLTARGHVQSNRSSVVSRTSPSPLIWATEAPYAPRDRARVSSIISKTSSDIELLNLYRSDRFNDPSGQPLGDIEGRLGSVCEERNTARVQRIAKMSPCISSSEKSIDNKVTKEGAVAAQELLKISSVQDLQAPKLLVKARLSLQSLPATSAAPREVDHHYSEIDLYDSCQNADGMTTRTTSANTTSSTNLHPAPPVPQHSEECSLNYGLRRS